MRLLFDMGKYGGGIVFAQQTEHAPDHGGELVDSKIRINKRRLLRRTTVRGSMDRGKHPQSMVRCRVFDRRVAPVAVPGAGIRGQTVSPARAALHYVRVFLDGRQRRFSSSLLSSAVCFAASVARSTRRSGLQISVVSRHSPFRLIGFFSEINGPHSHLINELRIIGIL